MTGFAQAVGIQQGAKTTWMKDARCVYGNATEILGHRVMDEDGTYLMTPGEFYLLIDKTFNSDSRWTSGRETHGLRDAVKECLSCPVQDECLVYAMNDTFKGITNAEVGIPGGVLGGTTAWERKTIADPVFMPHLNAAERLDFLRALVVAKKRGWASESVRIDLVRKEMALTAIPTRVECCNGCCEEQEATGPTRALPGPGQGDCGGAECACSGIAK